MRRRATRMTVGRVRTVLVALALTISAAHAPLRGSGSAPAQPPPQPAAPVFRSSLDMVSVDVVVRDRDGAVVRNLKLEDFELFEDGRPQQVRTFAFQAITAATSSVMTAELLAGAEDRLRAAAAQPPGASAAPVPAAPAAPQPMRSEDLAGRRLVVLLFDVSSMEPEDVQRSVDSARKYVADQMTPADLVAVATVSALLDVVTDFTSDKPRVLAALDTLGWTEGTAPAPVDAGTAATDEEAAAATEATEEAVSELDLFNNDMRLRALKTLAESLQPIDQKKAIVYFRAGMQRGGQDNQVELRAAINAAVRANVSIYAIDTRGLQAVVPGGGASQASGRGQGLFSGRGMSQQFARLMSSQDTLTTLSSDTGGRAFTDTNDFGEAFDRVRRDMSAYYLLGYATTNPARDGRFRRIQVRVKTAGLRVEARAGYYADRDFAHTARGDRESQLQQQLFAAVSDTDLPVLVTSSYFRVAADKFYVPVSVAVPGAFVPVEAGKQAATLDILGLVSDEQGRPVGRIRQTLKLPAGDAATLAGTQVLYQSAVTLPPGRFGIKVVARENLKGATGSFETPITVPRLDASAVKVSSVVLSTQLQPVRGQSDNPLVRDGVELLPNVTRVVSRTDKLFFYYEVYEPAVAAGQGLDVRTSLAFYRGKVKVLETPVVSRTALDQPQRKAAVFQFEMPAGSFEPGLYTCQITVIDEVAGTFAFPRLSMYVR